jgi:protein gp37
MADHSAIEWTDATWNPLRGCSRVSAGCQHCYAERVASRFSGPGMPYEGLIHPTTRGWNGQVRLVPEVLDQPLRWRRPRRIFVNSMSDLFHESMSDENIDQVFGVMWACLYSRYEQPGHVFQVLTKRPARMLEYLQQDRRRQWAQAAANYGGGLDPDGIYDQTLYFEGPHPRIWLGVSVENQAAADERIPLLLKAPAAVRWLSCEPLLGPVDLEPWLEWPDGGCELPDGRYFGCAGCETEGRDCKCPLARGTFHIEEGPPDQEGCPEWMQCERRTLDWVVIGGESGAGARPMHPVWARSLRDQCAAAGVPFFFKQWGDWAPHLMAAGSDMGGAMRAGRVRFLQGDGREPDGRFRPGDVAVERVGKRAAGRLLDGREHNEWPRTANPKEI